MEFTRSPLGALFGAIVARDRAAALAMLAELPALVRAIVEDGDVFFDEIKHYACDGIPGSRAWDPEAQGAVVRFLVRAGADPNAVDTSGVAPLHRAVRTRSTAAVRVLLEGGADVRLRNKSGSTPLHLAVRDTGRSGAGSVEAREEQAAIVQLLRDHGAR